MMKIKQDNDMTNGTGAFYAKNNTKLLWPIRSGAGCDEKKIERRDRLYRYSICFYQTKLSWLIGLGANSDQN